MQIAIVVYPGLTVLDIIGPYEVLRFIPGAEIRFVWAEPGPIIADSGVLALAATHSFAETPAPDIVLIGGSGPATAATAANTELLDWLRKVHLTSQWTVSVCTGSIILASAGLLEGQRATSHWSGLPLLEGLGVTPVGDERIVQSGKIVTGAGVSAGIDVALWLVGQISGDETARAAQLIIEYDPQPPYDSGSVDKADAAVKRKAAAIVAREGADLVVNEPYLIGKESAAMTRLVWKTAIHRIRSRRRPMRALKR
ncbi:DJ-1/PfpI family protein [Nocardia jejuensis]|uniref:DJ-1/PfpI family protein n=1 Tax=Nocardia jejuensis TaxID=328049 RepID=UPI000831F531|nr:DJ-1/PfpI family protein [Nocardia jejuensis]